MSDTLHRHPIDFGEFGVRFIHEAVTAERIGKRLAAMIGPIETIDGPATKQGFGTLKAAGALTGVSVKDLAPNDLQMTARYAVNLRLQLHIHLNLLEIKGDWESTFDIPVQLRIQAWQPLELELQYEPVLPEVIAVQLAGTGWLAGIADDTVKAGAAEKIAAKVNEKLEASLPDRRIMILDALAALDRPEDPAQPTPGDGQAKPLSHVPEAPTRMMPGEKVEGDLTPDKAGFLSIVIDPLTDTHLTIAARPKGDGDDPTYVTVKLYDRDMFFLKEIGFTDFRDVVMFGTLEMDFHVPDYKGDAIVRIETNNRPIQLRGKLSFSPHSD